MVGVPILLVLVSFAVGVLAHFSRKNLVVLFLLLMAFCTLTCPLVLVLSVMVTFVLLVVLILIWRLN